MKDLMKVLIPSQIAQNAVSLAKLSLSKNPALPILAYIKLSANQSKSKISFQSCSLESWTNVKASISIQDSGSVMIHADKFAKIIARHPNSDILVASENSAAVSVTCGSSTYTLRSPDPADFPEPPEIDDSFSNKHLVPNLFSSLKTVSIAVDKDDTRKIMAGVCICSRESKINFAATDGKRLALQYMPHNDKPFECVIPIDTVKKLCNVTSQSPFAYVQFTSNRALFAFVDSTLVVEFNTKIIEGKYPNYSRVIPDYSNSTFPKLHFVKEQLVDALKNVTIVGGENPIVKIDFFPDHITLSSQSDNNSAAETLNCNLPITDPVQLIVNTQFLLDAVSSCKSDSITLQFNPDFSPVLIKDQSGFLSVVMPIRTNSNTEETFTKKENQNENN